MTFFFASLNFRDVFQIVKNVNNNIGVTKIPHNKVF